MKFLFCINGIFVIFTLPWKVQQGGKIGNACFDKQGGKLKFQKHNIVNLFSLLLFHQNQQNQNSCVKTIILILTVM